jgi:hypothetical protein
MGRDLRDMPIRELLAVLRATEKSVGIDSQSARILREEVERRAEQPAPPPGGEQVPSRRAAR